VSRSAVKSQRYQWLRGFGEGQLAAILQTILRGDRNPALVADPNLDYLNAAEMQLLLEGLGAK